MCKNSQPQTTSQTNNPPPQLLADYQSLVNRGTANANVPYQPFQGEQVAPLTPQTTSGIGNVNNYAFSAQPAYQNASNMTQGAVAGANPSFSAAQGMTQNAAQAPNAATIGQYMNPFTNSVVNATQAEFNNQNQQQSQFLNSANISSGNSPFAGDRAGIAQAVLANQQNLAQAPVIAGLNQANYSQALGEANTEQQAQFQGATELGNLGLAQANLGLQGAGQLGNLGTAAQTAGLQGATAQTQAGMIPQQEQQALDTALMNQYAQSQAYPFQTTGWLGNIIEGTGSLSGGQSTTNAPAPSTASQTAGAGIAGLGLLGSFLSDIRIKEDVKPVGKTFDGQTIYRFRYEGDPRTQIGLIAQDVEKSHPSAVHRAGLGSLRHVNYKDATDASARRGHFQYGGPAGAYTGPPRPGTGAPVTPQAALAMLGNRGAAIGLNPTTVAANAYTPQGLLARQGFQGGGVSYPASPDPFIDFGGPTAIASGVGAPNPLSGVAALEYWAATQGGSGVAGGAGAGTNAGGTLTPESPTPGPVIGWNPSLYQGYTNPSYAGGNPVVPNFSPFAGNTHGGVTSGTPGTAFQTSQPQGGVNPYAGTTLAGLTGGSVTNPAAPSGTAAAAPTPAAPAAAPPPAPFTASVTGGQPQAYPYYSEVRGGMLNQTGSVELTPQEAALRGYAAGGMIGQSGLHHAMGYVPQGHGLTGQDSQGQGLGSIEQFGGMFGSRDGFASGGTPDQPWSNVITWVPNVGPLAIGPGPPHPGLPNQNNQPQSGILGQNPLQTGQGIGKSLSQISKSSIFGGGGGGGTTAAGGSISGALSNSGSIADDAALGSALADLASGGMVKKRRKGGRLRRDDGGGTGDGGDGTGDGTGDGSAAAAAAAAAVGTSDAADAASNASGGYGYGGMGQGAASNAAAVGGQSEGGLGPGGSTDATGAGTGLGGITGVNGFAFGNSGSTPGVANGLANGLGGSQGFAPGPGSGVANAAAAGLGLGGPGGGYGGVLGGIGQGSPSTGQVTVSPLSPAVQATNPLAVLASKGVNIGDLNSIQLGQMIAALHSGAGPTAASPSSTGPTSAPGTSSAPANSFTPVNNQLQTALQGYPPSVIAALNSQFAAQEATGKVTANQIAQELAGLHSGYPSGGPSSLGFTGSVTGVSPSAPTASPPSTTGQVAPAPANPNAPTTPQSAQIANQIATARTVPIATGTNNRGQASSGANNRSYAFGGRARRHFDDGGSTAPDTSGISQGILNVESSGGKNVGTSDRGAVGPGQIEPATFAQYAKPGEDINNPTDNLAVHQRIVNDYTQRYGGDPARVAVAYFSGPQNVAPPGSPTPWLHNVNDGHNTVAQYVDKATGVGANDNSVMGNSGGQGFFGMRAQASPDQQMYPDKHLGPITIPGELPGALMAAGFGMMAGRSPYAMVNIGQGGMQGMEYYQKEQQLERESGLSQAEIRHLDVETQQGVINLNYELNALKNMPSSSGGLDTTGSKGHGVAVPPTAITPPPIGPNVPGPVSSKVATAPLSAPAVTAAGATPSSATQPFPLPGLGGMNQFKAGALPPAQQQTITSSVLGQRNGLPNVPTAGAQPMQATAPSPVPPTGGPVGYDPSSGRMWAYDDPRWNQIDSEMDPFAKRKEAAALMAQAQALSFNPMTAPRARVLEQQAAIANSRAIELENQYTQASRTGAQEQAGALAKASPEVASAEAEKARKVAASEEGGKTMPEIDTQVGAAANTRANVANRLETLLDLNEKAATGALADAQKTLSSYAQYFGIDPKYATNIQEFTKNATAEIYQELKEQKGQVRNMEIQGYTKQMAAAENTPASNRFMLLQALGAVDKENLYANQYFQWRDTPEGQRALSPGSFENQFSGSHDPQEFQNKRFVGWATTHPQPVGVPQGSQLGMNRKGEPIWRDPTGKKYDWQGNPE